MRLFLRVMSFHSVQLISVLYSIFWFVLKIGFNLKSSLFLERFIIMPHQMRTDS